MGAIYPCMSLYPPRGALIPPSLYLTEEQRECYLPDATLEQIEAWRLNFAQRSLQPQPLPIDLVISLDGARRLDCPIFFIVQTASDDLVKEPIDQIQHGHWNSRAPSPTLVSGGTYVTLSISLKGQTIRKTLYYPEEVLDDPDAFATYFDFHNLILKSRCYRELIEMKYFVVNQEEN